MDFDPRKIDPKYNEPINRLILAINHYISTGDHLGEGVAQPEAGKIRVLLPVNQHMDQDQADFKAFKSKFDQISSDFKLTLDDHGSQGLFRLYSFLIAESNMDALAAKLTDKPGPMGWGSPKQLIDKLL